MNNYIRRLGINELKTTGVVNKYDHRLSEDVNGIISSQFLNGLLTTFSPGYNQPGSRIHSALETDHHELARNEVPYHCSMKNQIQRGSSPRGNFRRTTGKLCVSAVLYETGV